MDLPILPYQVDGITFAPNGQVSIQFAQAEDVAAGVSLFRQLNLEVGLTEDIAQLTMEIMEAVCQLIDLAGVELRSPPAAVAPRRVMGAHPSG